MQTPPPALPALGELNSLDQAAFAEALKPLFETAPPLAQALWQRRPYRSYAQLLDQAEASIASLAAEQQVEVVNAHPRIGEGASVVRQRSLLSYAEQGYAAEAALPESERERIYRELAQLNRAYEERFGFRFVVFVNGRPKSAIIEVLRERMGRSREQELRTGLAEMLAIARDRLRKLAG